MALQELPRGAAAYAAKQRRENAAAVAASLQLWRGVGDDFEAGFLRIAPELIAVMNTAQRRISENAQAFVPDILDSTGQSRANRPSIDIDPGAFVGTSGDGRPTESLAYGAVTHTKDALAKGATLDAAKRSGGEYLSLALGTMFSDTGRGMESFETFVRPVSGWVRQLTPPSCGRCVILAGRFYRKNKGFERHPGCDCRHIPTSEDVGGEITIDPNAYLDSLDPEGLRKALGSQANADAYSQYGANANQLVNAYRKSGGIRTAQVYGKTVKYTQEGTTVRGVASYQMRRVRALSAVDKQAGDRYRRVVAPRLMPESIFQIAENQDHAYRLLRDHGWLGITP